MKCCLIIGRSRQIGGAEKTIHILAGNLKSSSWHITTEYVSDREMRFSFLNLGRIFFTRYDLIHSHLFIPGFFISLKRFFDRRFVWVHTAHYGGYSGQKFSYIKRLVDRYLVFRRADRLIAVSDSVETWLQQDKSLICKTLKIFNSVDPFPEVLDLAKSIRLKGSVVTLGMTAMLRPEKGIDEMIRAVGLLKSQGFKIKLLIAGEGPEKSNLDQLISELRLDNEVKLLGYQKQIYSFLKRIDLFVNASTIESFGIALIESLLAAKPIVAPRVGEIPNILQQGKFGKLVDNRSSKNFAVNLAAAIAEVIVDLNNYQDRARLGQIFFQDKFSAKKMIDDHETLYRRLLSPAICMICPIITHVTGGIQKQLLLQSRALAKKGYQIFLLQKRDPLLHDKYHDWKHAEFLQTPTAYGVGWGNSNLVVRVEGLLFIFLGLWQIVRHKRKLRILHAHQLYSPALAGIFAKMLLGVPLVVKITASGKFGELNELKRLPMLRLRKYLFQSIDSLIVLSEEMRSEMKELGFEDHRIRLIPNSVEECVEIIDPPFEVRQTQKTLKILYTGRISVEKSLGTLIQAADILAKSGVICELNLVGGSHGGRDDSAYLHGLCKSTDKNLKVIFHGNQKNIEHFYQESHVFVLPSISEGMSNSLLEAMSAGLPVIVSNIPANLFVITPEYNGLSFIGGNVSDLAHQLSRLLIPGEGLILRTCLQKNATLTIQNQFSVPSVVSKLDHLYRSLSGVNHRELQ